MELEEAIKTIMEIKTLPSNWNDNGANPFSDKLIEKALDLVKQLTPTPKVFCTACNSIHFEWEEDGLYVQMEVFEDKIKMFSMANIDGRDVTIGDT